MIPYIISGTSEKAFEKQLIVADSRGWDVAKKGNTWMGNYRKYWAVMKKKETKLETGGNK